MLNVQNLSFTYPKATTQTLKDVNFRISKGEVFGLLGPSGAGKSTTQSILMRLLNGYGGKVEMFGQPITQIDRSFYDRIGVSFELPALYQRLTARENLQLFGALYNVPTMPIIDCLSLVDLANDADKRVASFSKGMKMRLNLCRALLHDPDFLFLDEPTTGQDPARARLTRDLIKRLKSEGKTIFLTTHNMAEADEVCDRIAFLHQGTIPLTGTPSELKRKFGSRTLEVITGTQSAQQHHEFPMSNIGRNPAFLELMHNDNILSLHTKEASLDEVFIKVVNQ
ncbi:ABC transporter ATP-binding protein [uncultured Maritalea sp.]|jgi:fluoroquinolone transport system ATP-binding protein|uniref:ABC transporter ATP-binding protein n=1 Tax=uncultured Maritalea sp. TaxID=757249 RepID=UPI00260F5D7F|nr:ABC transporter ATP-binding protein [uncultured Maritalea sp.]